MIRSLLLLHLLLPPLALGQTETVRGDLSVRGIGFSQVSSLEGDWSQPEFLRKLQAISDLAATDSLSSDTLMVAALRGMVEAINDSVRATDAREDYMPPAAALLSPQQVEQAKMESQGRFVGLGMGVQALADGSGLRVSWVLSGSPAEAGNIVQGDRILAINGMPTHGTKPSEDLQALSGAPDSPVTLDLSGSTGTRRITLTRRVLDLPCAQLEPAGDGLWRLALMGIHGGCPEEVQTHIETARKGELRGLVLDLRDNVGGSLDAGVALADLFLNPGVPVVRVLAHDGSEEDHVSASPPAWDGPLTVLVNRWTAGVSEMLAATLQESGRAQLVGETTVGRGWSQTLLPLPGGAALRLPTLQLRTPLGVSWSGKGLQPDQPIQPLRGTLSSQDVQWETALHSLRAIAVRYSPPQ